MTYTPAQIAAAASSSCFYVTPDHETLRIEWCEDDSFTARDENTGEDYTFFFDDLAQIDEPHFLKLIRAELK